MSASGAHYSDKESENSLRQHPKMKTKPPEIELKYCVRGYDERS